MRQSHSTGKEDCHIIDFVDSRGRVAGMFSTPSLFGLHPNEILPGESLSELLEKRDKNKEAEKSELVEDIPDISSVSFVEHEDAIAMRDEMSRNSHIRKLSRYDWVTCGDTQILECLGRGRLRINRKVDEGNFAIALFGEDF